MAELAGVKIEKLQGGLGRQNPSTDGHVALIVPETLDPMINSKIENGGKGVVLRSLLDVKLVIGITESEIMNAGGKFYHQIADFFRLAPEGTLYLYNNFNPDPLYKFLKYNQEIKGFAFETNALGIEESTQNTINKLALENHLIDFGIIGKLNFDPYDNFIDLTELNCPQISVLISGPGGVNAGWSTGLGAILGMIAVRKVNENLGSVNIQNKPLEKRGNVDYSLTDKNQGLWIAPIHTLGGLISELAKEILDQLNNFGYIFAASYQGYPGVFFSNSKTCVSAASDYSFIENNRVWNKAARTIRQALLPEVKGVVKKDPNTGYIRSTTVSRWTGIANKALENMVANDEISGFKVVINPAQIVNGTSPVQIKATVVMDGIVHEFEVALGLTNSIN